MNAIDKLFTEKKGNILSVYFTAGFPKLNDTISILESLQKNGVDLIEIGIPFSDPLADGPVIQESSRVALENGMNIKLLFQQLKHLSLFPRHTPLILMGYLNPVMQFGMEKFCKCSNELGISGIILPDLPLDVYEKEYKSIFEKYDLKNIFLITPQTSEERIRLIDEKSNGFIYMVSSASTTGVKNAQAIEREQENYFARIKSMQLKNPLVIGFGISNHQTFSKACEYAQGAIIGSAFIKQLQIENTELRIREFVKEIRS